MSVLPTYAHAPAREGERRGHDGGRGAEGQSGDTEGPQENDIGKDAPEVGGGDEGIRRDRVPVRHGARLSGGGRPGPVRRDPCAPDRFTGDLHPDPRGAGRCGRGLGCDGRAAPSPLAWA